ncbi:MAG TPA: VOC family protein [Bryobacteraceae bacterium]|nr:VOC family protein [Bryobacteraceae bacterium]
MALKRMDNIGIVVDDLGAAIDFFRELGLDLEGRAMIEGEWAGRVTGLGDQRVEIAMMRTPDGHGRLELSGFLTPPAVADHRNAPVNALGYLRVMFTVDDIDETLERLRKHGAELVGEVVRIGSATSAGLKGFSSDSHRNLAERRMKTTPTPKWGLMAESRS